MENKFYIIARPCKSTGIGAILNGFISHILYAVDKGYLPICDLKHYKNQYFKDGREYKDNIWEYFFEQPCGYRLEDLTDESDIIISENKLYVNSDYTFDINHLPVDTLESSNSNINILRKRYQEFIKFNSETKDYVESEYQRIVGDSENVLGVLARGTDYLIRKTKDHQINPNPAMIMDKIDEFLNKHPEISKIYLATEDDAIYQLMKNKYGDMIIDNGQYRYRLNKKNEKKLLADIKVQRPNHNYQLAMEYMASLYILSKCKYYIGGRCAGSKIVWIMQNDWKELYMWNLGRYGHENKFLKNIFSVDYEYNSKRPHKIYKFMGLKLAVADKKVLVNR